MHPPRQSDRGFGFTFAVFFVILFGALWLLFGVVAPWLVLASAVFLVLALVCPLVLLPLNRIWGAFAVRAAAFNNRVVLGVIFFVLLLPAGILVRVLGEDPLRRRLEPSGTYWTPVKRSVSRETLKDMF